MNNFTANKMIDDKKVTLNNFKQIFLVLYDNLNENEKLNLYMKINPNKSLDGISGTTN